MPNLPKARNKETVFFLFLVPKQYYDILVKFQPHYLRVRILFLLVDLSEKVERRDLLLVGPYWVRGNSTRCRFDRPLSAQAVRAFLLNRFCI